jgi:hypothetical protein
MTRLRPHLAGQLLGLSPRTLHKWAREGRIVRHWDGFELADLLAAESTRDQRALLIRAGIARKHWPAAAQECQTPTEESDHAPE